MTLLPKPVEQRYIVCSPLPAVSPQPSVAVAINFAPTVTRNYAHGSCGNTPRREADVTLLFVHGLIAPHDKTCRA